MFEVVEAGLQSTIQDAGRPEWTHLGVPVAGACDAWSLAVANLLVGNEPGAAALEMTVAGPVLSVRSDVVVGLAGADLDGLLRPAGRRLEPGRTHALEAGATIAFPGLSAAEDHGARGYLAVPGGFDVPVVLGSRSTSLAGAFGGVAGRPIRAGDRLSAATPARGDRRRDVEARFQDADVRAWPELDDDPLRGDPLRPVRLLRGPAAGIDGIVCTGWRVAAGSDRVGLRLEGPPLQPPGDGRMLSHGLVFGAVQLPPDGRPIVLLADHQTTGGYPVPAIVASVDRPRLGQLRPGGSVSFVEADEAEALAALARQRAALARGAALLREAAGWDALWQSAGG